MKKLFLLLMTVCSLAFTAMADRTVQGQVTDAATGEPLIGATVQPVGRGQGVATDIDGAFTLKVPDNVSYLNVSYVGYKAQQVAVANYVNVALEAENTTFDEVIVVAYGTSKKTSFTGSAQAVSNKKIETRPITSATKALEGNVGGI